MTVPNILTYSYREEVIAACSIIYLHTHRSVSWAYHFWKTRFLVWVAAQHHAHHPHAHHPHPHLDPDPGPALVIPLFEHPKTPISNW